MQHQPSDQHGFAIAESAGKEHAKGPLQSQVMCLILIGISGNCGQRWCGESRLAGKQERGQWDAFLCRSQMQCLRVDTVVHHVGQGTLLLPVRVHAAARASPDAMAETAV